MYGGQLHRLTDGAVWARADHEAHRAVAEQQHELVALLAAPRRAQVLSAHTLRK
jgi:hypothetical protein